ncbi:MAG: single-stranded DNA-binding protein [Thermoguttaceae bacterium]|jgi:single-strand DNA-binding protein
MASYNRVVLVGNTTRDVELRKIPSGTEVCDLGLAVNERRRDAQGNWVEDTTFVDVTLWGRTAVVAAEYTRKGSPVLIEGRLKTDTWETDGQKRSKLKVVADRLVLLGSRGTGGAGAASSSGYQQPQQSPYQDAPSSFEPNDIADGDLPF